MKFLLAIFLFSIFTIDPVFTHFTGTNYIFLWRLGSRNIKNRYHDNYQNYINSIYLKRDEVKESEKYRKEMAEIVPKIRAYAKNEAATIGDYEIQDMEKLFPVTFMFYGQSLTFELKEYLPEILFPAIGKAAKKPEFNHFCIQDQGESYTISKNDEEVGLLLGFLATNLNSANILWCPLDLVPRYQ